MTSHAPFDTAATTAAPLPGLGRRALAQLRVSLERDLGAGAAAVLQEAGFAAGEETFAAFTAWLAAKTGVAVPGDLDAAHLADALDGFFRDIGWGPLRSTMLTDGVLAFDSEAWAESTNTPSSLAPACHLSCGLLADLLGRVAGHVVAVMEVECRSRGDARCRFLAGSPETLGALYERLAAGQSYASALGLEG